MTGDELYERAITATKAGKNREAIALWREYVRSEPTCAVGYNNLGHLLSLAGDLRAAISALQTAVTLDPEYAIAFGNLGFAQGVAGHNKQSVESYTRAVELENNAVRQYNLANALDRVGEAAKAIEHYRAALSLQPNHKEAHHNLANVLVGIGEFSQALEHYRVCVQLSPTDLQARRKLAGALEIGGWISEADEVCQGVLREAPNDPSTMMIQAMIRQDRARSTKSLADAEDALSAVKAALSCNRLLPFAWRNLIYAYLSVRAARKRARASGRS